MNGRGRIGLRKELRELTVEAIGNLPLSWKYIGGMRRVTRMLGEDDRRDWRAARDSADSAWESPVRLRFHVVSWRHGDAAAIGYVPALDIEVVADRGEDLERQLVEQIRYALMRPRAAHRCGSSPGWTAGGQ